MGNLEGRISFALEFHFEGLLLFPSFNFPQHINNNFYFDFTKIFPRKF